VAFLVLYDTVHIITGYTILIAFFFFIDMELVAIVSVQTISGGRPNKAIVVKIYLIGEITR
jgi:hypothetical protein